MKKGNRLLKGMGMFAAAAILFVFAMSAGVQGVQPPEPTPDRLRADRITIDGLKMFGRLERPPVQYLHQKHTDALEKQNKDCRTCHLLDNNRLSPKFKRLEDTGKKAVMDVYHAECVGCHRQTAKAGEKSGPVTCGDCHLEKPTVGSNWQPLGMDKSLHYRHAKAQDNKCETCHHVYDDQAQKLVYAKGQEGTCRYCHGEKTVEKRISLRLAAHQACIECHTKTLAQNKAAGPVKCNGCHNPEDQALYEIVKNVPRMNMNQPDTVFVKTAVANPHPPALPPDGLMNPVPFNHKAHEEANATCRVCHHADLASCAKCHTLAGAKEGKQIKLAKAMHQLGSEQSCIGCHTSRQKQPQCAGCHAAIEQRSINDEAGCRVCHLQPPMDAPESTPAPDAPTRAAMLLAARQAAAGTYAPEDIPEKVAIGTLSDRYRPVEMPHRKIVLALTGNIKDDKLAQYFHRETGTVCQGCHHSSPAAKKPPKCSSCHGQPFDERNPFKPGLMAAYHQQCMDCHRRMGIAKPVATNCKECHKLK